MKPAATALAMAVNGRSRIVSLICFSIAPNSSWPNC